MENKQIKDLMLAMGKMGITRLSIKNGDFELELERGDQKGEQPFVMAPYEVERRNYEGPYSFKKGDIPPALHTPVDTQPAAVEGVGITAPMVGTFYGSASPDDPPFVKVGDTVNPDTIVCIIEAMKVMNEVKAGVKGTIAQVMVEDGHPVEFGTKLFRVS